MAASDPLQLDPAILQEIADRLGDAVVARVIEALRAEGLIPQARAATEWLDAREVAQRLRVSREWVYEHAESLGAARIGEGPRPRLRFPAQVVRSRGDSPTASRAASQPAIAKPKADGLIPIRPQ